MPPQDLPCRLLRPSTSEERPRLSLIRSPRKRHQRRARRKRSGCERPLPRRLVEDHSISQKISFFLARTRGGSERGRIPCRYNYWIPRERIESLGTPSKLKP